MFSLVSFALFFPACGGGGGSDGGGGTPNATITGTVTGTIVVAVNANDNEVTRNTATGSPKTFTLSVPVGGNYRFCLIENENTPQERYCFLYQGTTNIFQISSATTIDLGFVDTSSGHGIPANNPLNCSGVTSGGENPNIPLCISAPFTGTWSGTMGSNVGTGPMTFNLTQSGANVSGTVSGLNPGAISGTISGNTMNYTVTFSVSCQGTHSGIATLDGNTMSLTWSGHDCFGTHSNGTGTLTKQ